MRSPTLNDTTQSPGCREQQSCSPSFPILGVGEAVQDALAELGMTEWPKASGERIEAAVETTIRTNLAAFLGGVAHQCQTVMKGTGRSAEFEDGYIAAIRDMGKTFKTPTLG